MFDAAMGNMRKCRNYCSSPHLDWIAFTRGSSDGDSKILGESLVILMFEILGGRDMSNIIVNQYSYFASVCPTLVTDEDCNITLVSILSWRRHPQTLSKRSNFYWRDTAFLHLPETTSTLSVGGTSNAKLSLRSTLPCITSSKSGTFECFTPSNT